MPPTPATDRLTPHTGQWVRVTIHAPDGATRYATGRLNRDQPTGVWYLQGAGEYSTEGWYIEPRHLDYVEPLELHVETGGDRSGGITLHANPAWAELLRQAAVALARDANSRTDHTAAARLAQALGSPTGINGADLVDAGVEEIDLDEIVHALCGDGPDATPPAWATDIARNLQTHYSITRRRGE